MLDHTQAAALLAALEAAHGPDVLAELVGATFRASQADYYAEYAEADGIEAASLEAYLALGSTAEESYGWCAEFCNRPAFSRVAGLR